jgi:predicted acylesterase/phospholipase RssA
MRALVLSGGAAFGAYQAGAWAALDAAGWSPDLVVGASIGAVNGFALSRGASVSELCELWTIRPGLLLEGGGVRDRFPVWGQRRMFRRWLDDVVSEFSARPRRWPLRITVTEMLTMNVRIFDDEEITAKHLMASCALPGVMPAVRIDGRLCIDGGFLHRVPLRAALKAGATQAVTVDLLAVHPAKRVRHIPRMINRLRGEFRDGGPIPTADELKGVDVIAVEHDKLLGDFWDSFEWSRAKAEKLIATGRADAERALIAARIAS